MGLLHAQKAGHKSLALIGGATARIGDPSGKSSERPAMSKSDLNQNVSGLERNLRHIFAHFKAQTGIPGPEIVNNSAWYEEMNVIDFLADFGRHYRLSKMLAKESVKKRLEAVQSKADPHGGMSFSEFSYQAFQAYDWLHLSQEFDCFVQLGGHDQMGNISAGHDLIKRVSGKDAYGLLLPLVTTESGQKLGKSEGNAIWLSPDMTSSFELFQYFVRIPDLQVEQMLHFFTFLPANEIKDLMQKSSRQPEKREAQLRLAKEVTQLVHGDKGLSLALKTTDLLYGQTEQDVLETLRTLSTSELKKIFSKAASASMLFQPGMTVLDLVMKLGLFKNEKAAQSVIQAGGFYINQCRRINIDEIVMPGDHILPNDLSLVRVGKKHYVIVNWLL